MVIKILQHVRYHLTKNIFQPRFVSLTPHRIFINIPVFVTAFSTNHFKEGRAMFYNFNETVRGRYPNLKLYFFDIGLTKEEALEASAFRYIFFIYTILLWKDNSLQRYFKESQVYFQKYRKKIIHGSICRLTFDER